MSVTLAQAQKVLQAARAAAEGMNIKVSVAVVDDHGDLIAFSRMDVARHTTVVISQGKALVSAFFGQPSGVLAERAGSPVLQSLMMMYQGRLVFGQGAVPISQNNQVVGAVGVSGGTGQQDEEVAKAGVAAL